MQRKIDFLYILLSQLDYGKKYNVSINGDIYKCFLYPNFDSYELEIEFYNETDSYNNTIHKTLCTDDDIVFVDLNTVNDYKGLVIFLINDTTYMIEIEFEEDKSL